MNRKEIFDKLKEIVSSGSGYSDDVIDSISEDTDLRSDLGLSSVNMLYIVIAAEEEFGIRFSEVGMNEFRTVGDVIDYIEKKLN